MSIRRAAVLLALAFSLVAAQVACTADRERPIPTSTPVSELEPGEYRSTSLTSTTGDEFTDPADSLSLTISRDGNYRLSIDDGCNVQSGPFHIDDGIITVTKLSATFVACEPPRGDSGTFASDLLSAPVSATRAGADLSWANSTDEIVFVRAD